MHEERCEIASAVWDAGDADVAPSFRLDSARDLLERYCVDGRDVSIDPGQMLGCEVGEHLAYKVRIENVRMNSTFGCDDIRN